MPACVTVLVFTLGWLLPAAAAFAAGPVGIWRPDPAATAAMVDRLVTEMAAMIDPEDKAEVEAQLPVLRARLAEIGDSDPEQAAELTSAIEQMERIADGDEAGFRDELRQSILAGLDMTLELKPGGEMLVRGGDPEETDRGNWTMEGDRIELVGAGEDSDLHMQGVVAGDRMELREVLPPEEEGDDENAALMREVVLTLIRR